MESRPTTPSSGGILDVMPREMIVNFLSVLTGEDLDAVARVCRTLYYESGSKLIWGPRLIDQFNVTPPPSVDHRYLYNALQQEQKLLIRHLVFLNLLKKAEEHGDMPEEIKSLGLIPTIANICKIAGILDLDYSVLDNIFQYHNGIISSILKKPNGFFTQSVFKQISTFHGKYVSDLLYQFTPEEEKSFCEFFPEAATKSKMEREKYLNNYLSFFEVLASLNTKNFMIILLIKHPELAKITFDERHGISLLHAAINAESYDFARLLISLGADVNKTLTYVGTDTLREEARESPLYLAMKNLVFTSNVTKAAEAVKFIHDLLAAGADLFAPYVDGLTGRESTPYNFYLKLQTTHQYDQLLDQIANPITKKNHARIWENLKRTIGDTLEQSVTSCRLI